ncbi:hypothetical protein EYC84_003566 [Monilinia fructicola]|uniref:Uncharacterized protein n=1 Tax=Monilinia fructicola TaxID=38448 RepID=A0A5M9JU18_MONFR|nr:hypothetical protein EYC84_003566 [Monilinia fructicola]
MVTVDPSPDLRYLRYRDQAENAVLRVVVISCTIEPIFCSVHVARIATKLQTTTTTTSLATGAVGWGWCNILNTANLHAGTGKSTESGLSTWTWSLGSFLSGFLPPVARILMWRAVMPNSLQRAANILSSQHSSVWGRLVTIGLDLHSTGDTADGFAATGITQKVSL